MFFEMVRVEDHLQHAAAHFARNCGLLSWKMHSRVATANSRSTTSPEYFVHFATPDRYTRN